MKPESTQPAVMQPIAEPPPAYSPTAAQPLISAELQRKEEVKIHLLINKYCHVNEYNFFNILCDIFSMISTFLLQPEASTKLINYLFVEMFLMC